MKKILIALIALSCAASQTRAAAFDYGLVVSGGLAGVYGYSVMRQKQKTLSAQNMGVVALSAGLGLVFTRSILHQEPWGMMWNLGVAAAACAIPLMYARFYPRPPRRRPSLQDKSFTKIDEEPHSEVDDKQAHQQAQVKENLDDDQIGQVERARNWLLSNQTHYEMQKIMKIKKGSQQQTELAQWQGFVNIMRFKIIAANEGSLAAGPLLADQMLQPPCCRIKSGKSDCTLSALQKRYGRKTGEVLNGTHRVLMMLIRGGTEANNHG